MIDCMSCLVQLAQDFPTNGGAHTDQRGTTHATVRWQGEIIVVCTLYHVDNRGVREWLVTDATVRVW